MSQKLYNVDHQYAILSDDKPGVAPGDSHVFTDDEIEAGVVGLWSEDDPRAGLKAERAFRKRRDAKAPGAEDASDDANPEDPAEAAGDAGAEAAEADVNPPAESGEEKE